MTLLGLMVGDRSAHKNLVWIHSMSHYLPALTQHNVVFQAQLMADARKAICSDTFPTYVRDFFSRYFGGPNDAYPRWCVDALRSVGIDLLEGEEGAERRVVEGDGAKWEYSDRGVE